MYNPNDYCPECGGVFFSGSSLVHEHHDCICTMRFVAGEWVSKDSLPKATPTLTCGNNHFGPQKVGGRYYNGYWKCEYTVLAISPMRIVCRQETDGITGMVGEVMIHGTAWDSRLDKVLVHPAMDGPLYLNGYGKKKMICAACLEHDHANCTDSNSLEQCICQLCYIGRR